MELSIEDLPRVVITAELGSVAAASSSTTTVLSPEGFGLLRAIWFNPQVNSRITIQSQNMRKVIVDKFATQVGNSVGRLVLNQGIAENDRYNIEIVNLETTNKVLSVSFEFVKTI